MQKDIRTTTIQPLALLPLRLFLGVTFVYAGIQKITDTQFFQVSANGFIGRQIARFAIGSPLHDLLVNVAQPHAKFFGLIIIFGEIAIGLGTLFGFLFRPAAFFGAVLSLLFFLSASFHVYPYFYGADIVFTFAWITLMLYGPLNTGLPTLDEMLTLRLVQSAPVQYQQRVAMLASIVLGIGGNHSRDDVAVSNQPTQQLPRRQLSRQNVLAQKRQSRRTFLWGSLVGGATTLGVVALGYAWRIVRGSDDTSTAGSTTTGGASNSATASSGTPTTGGTTIAQVSAVPKNSALQFTVPSTGDPGVLIHLNNDQFVAYDALCTHAGCQVSYDASSQLLQCPCHGAAFDPAKDAAVVSPPAPSPLAGVKIQVDSATGTISVV